MTISNEKLLRIKDVATRLNVSVATAWRLIKNGKLTAIRIGKSVRVQPADLEAYIIASMDTLEDKARNRISDMGFTKQQLEYIFTDWPEGDDHLEWLLTATRDEIVSWGDAGEWGTVAE